MGLNCGYYENLWKKSGLIGFLSLIFEKNHNIFTKVCTNTQNGVSHIKTTYSLEVWIKSGIIVIYLWLQTLYRMGIPHFWSFCFICPYCHKWEHESVGLFYIKINVLGCNFFGYSNKISILSICDNNVATCVLRVKKMWFNQLFKPNF